MVKTFYNYNQLISELIYKLLLVVKTLHNLLFQYGYEHFLEQLNLYDLLTSSDFGLSTFLITSNYSGKIANGAM